MSLKPFNWDADYKSDKDERPILFSMDGDLLLSNDDSLGLLERKGECNNLFCFFWSLCKDSLLKSI